jgi:serine/threonine protein kinase
VRKPIPFGKYYLLERVSVGGMAEVFKAKAFGIEGFEKILAVKRILPTMAEDEDFIAMFIDEAKICGQLSHPNVCQIYELGCIDDTHFIAMEYIHGKDVLQIQNRFRKMRQAMPPQMAAYISSKMCEGLDYAHRKKNANGELLNIIHRDVSPQNILVAYEGEVKVIDFGIAKAANRSNKTQAGILKGKFGYMSPEQVRGLPLDRRSDVFAVGTVLYEMLTAERLFVGESDFSTLEKVRNVDVQLPSVLNPKIPKQLEEITMKALAKSSEERYQWANDMADDLNRFLMSQEPMYSAKRLAHWMKTTFADDLARDNKKMELYRSVKQTELAAGVPLPDEGQSGQVAVGAAAGAAGAGAAGAGAGAGARPGVAGGRAAVPTSAPRRWVPAPPPRRSSRLTSAATTRLARAT